MKAAKAILCCPFPVVHRLAKSDNEIALTYYGRGVANLDQGSHTFEGEDWKGIRATAETAFFGDDNKREIHFAALSFSDTGLSHFGNCSVTLRTSLIAHRTSVFHENMLAFFKRRLGKYWRTERVPKGYRSTWRNRGKLAAAKVASALTPTTTAADFPRLILSAGRTPAQDSFIELHVFGNLTARAFERVVLTSTPTDVSKAVVDATIHDLLSRGVKWIDRSTRH